MIVIQNVYYMLSYAFQVLHEQGYKKIATEEFDNTVELCATILSKGIAVQIKRGLGREYIPVTESKTTLRGKLEISDSIKNWTLLKKQLICTYDEFSVDSYMNRILKSTMLFLLRSDFKKKRKKELRKLMVYFKDVKECDIHHINWNIQYNRNNQTYQMLLSICSLVIKGLLQTQSDGTTKLMDFLDEQRMYHLYEKFVLEYYRREFPQITVNASQIAWQLDNEEKEFLPIMQSDLMLSYQNKILILDAKYYGKIMQVRFQKSVLLSANLYQIFTYVKNKQIKVGKQMEVSGMLLYAQTEEHILPGNEYLMSGNKIAVRTLNLNEKFSLIKEQLNQIVEQYLGVIKVS